MKKPTPSKPPLPPDIAMGRSGLFATNSKRPLTNFEKRHGYGAAPMGNSKPRPKEK